METDASPRDLRDTLLPDLASVSDAARDAWRPEVTDPALREELWRSEALADIVLADLLRQAGLGDANGCEAGDGHDRVTDLLRLDIEALRWRAGMVRHGHQIARLVSAGKLDTGAPGWNVEDLRFVLSLRAHSRAEDVDPAHLYDAVNASGEACAAAWLHALPERLRRAISLCRSLRDSLPAPRPGRDEDAGIFNICVARMAAGT